MLAWLRKVTPFEYLIAILVIVTVATWSNPLPRLWANKPTHFILLHGIAMLAGVAVGSRALFVRDRMFAAFQWFGFFGVGVVPTLMLMGIHALAYEHPSLGLMALGWMVGALSALAFMLPVMAEHPSRRYAFRRNRLRWIAPFVLVCVIGALITLLLPEPKADPAGSPYRAWFPGEAS